MFALSTFFGCTGRSTVNRPANFSLRCIFWYRREHDRESHPDAGSSRWRLYKCERSRPLFALRRKERHASQATQIIMDHTGYTRHCFDAKDSRVLAKAEERFKELTLVGFTAAVRTAEPLRAPPLAREEARQ